MSIRGAGRNFVVRYALEQIVRFVALMFAVSFVVFALVSGFAHRSRSNERRPGGLYDDERSQAGATRPILGRGHAVA